MESIFPKKMQEIKNRKQIPQKSIRNFYIYQIDKGLENDHLSACVDYFTNRTFLIKTNKKI